ncbi:hypothetical protein [Streptomyces iakyrus]|uniref:hypothetical protein n=1 Tax=Streptomyces iakyrus TaxID=68219 RepID=UPI003D8DA088
MTVENTLRDLRRLATVCPPPLHPACPESGESEQSPQVVPPGHRELIHTYGVGCFDEFLWLFADGAPNSNLDITENTRRLRSILRDRALPRLSHVFDEFHCTPDQLIQWGVTDNADMLAWIATGDPENWPTVIIQAGQLGAVVSPTSSTATVLHLLTGALRVPFFPGDFPTDQPEFSADPYA